MAEETAQILSNWFAVFRDDLSPDELIEIWGRAHGSALPKSLVNCASCGSFGAKRILGVFGKPIGSTAFFGGLQISS
jgi:hypothetical protein